MGVARRSAAAELLVETAASLFLTSGPSSAICIAAHLADPVDFGAGPMVATDLRAGAIGAGSDLTALPSEAASPALFAEDRTV